MRLLARCDGAPTVGMGHVVRSGALAGALREIGATVEFAMRFDRPEGARAIRASGFHVHDIFGDDDALALVHRYDAVLVDTYEVETPTLERFAEHAPLAVIDDDGERDLRSAAWLLNQNLGAGHLDYRLAPGAVQLFGPSYALLRPEFAQARRRLVRSFDTARSVLVTFGGGDVERYHKRVLCALEDVSGMLDITLLGVEHLPAPSRHNTRAIRLQTGVPECMAACDVAITAAGTTVWELCCMQVPAFAVPIAQNQQIVAGGIGRTGAMRVYSSFETAMTRLAGDVPQLLQDAAERENLARRAGELVDGMGARRAAESLCALMKRFGRFRT